MAGMVAEKKNAKHRQDPQHGEDFIFNPPHQYFMASRNHGMYRIRLMMGLFPGYGEGSRDRARFPGNL
jgi:hypothetical protein